MEASLLRAFHEGTLRVIARDTEDDSRGIVINKTLALLELGWGYRQLTNDKFETPDLPTLQLSSKPCVCCFLGCLNAHSLPTVAKFKPSQIRASTV